MVCHLFQILVLVHFHDKDLNLRFELRHEIGVNHHDGNTYDPLDGCESSKWMSGGTFITIHSKVLISRSVGLKGILSTL